MEEFELKGGRWLSPVLSLFIYPGAGQWRNQQKTKALVVGLLFTVGCVGCVYQFAIHYSKFFDAIQNPGDIGDLMGYITPGLKWGAVTFFIWLVNGIDAMIFAKADQPEEPLQTTP